MTSINEFNRKALLQQVLDQFKLNREGYHGPSHWARVRLHALEIGPQLDKLCHAIRHHSGGSIHTDETIQSCWDGDRLDLGRVGTKPHKDYLSPEGAKLIEKAYRRSLQKKESELAIEDLLD